jgi:hypothetical protein
VGSENGNEPSGSIGKFLDYLSDSWSVKKVSYQWSERVSQ